MRHPEGPPTIKVTAPEQAIVMGLAAIQAEIRAAALFAQGKSFDSFYMMKEADRMQHDAFVLADLLEGVSAGGVPEETKR